MRVLLIFLGLFALSCSRARFQSLDEEDSRSFLSSVSSSWETEEFSLSEKKSLVDILIVADASPSMYHHLSDLGRNLSSFSFIAHYDWQIGITSADHGDQASPLALQDSWRDYVMESHGQFGGLMHLENENRLLEAKILSPKTANYEAVFFHTLSHPSHIECHRPPHCQPPMEQPLRSLKSAMQRAALDNKAFFRPQADFVSLVISNEEERAEDRKRATRPEQVVAAFNNIFGHLDKKFIAFNILVLDEECLAMERSKGSEAQAAGIAHSIARLAHLTGGENISICSRDYGKALRKLSQHIANSLENSVLLKKEPIPGSARVEFLKGEDLAWRQHGRNILFENRTEGPVSVSVSYQSRE